MTAPTTTVVSTPASSETHSVHQPAMSRSPKAFNNSATVYAPTAISAPCPSDTWPLRPTRTVSPAVAHRYAATVASW
jgi:hypothetical protein